MAKIRQIWAKEREKGGWGVVKRKGKASEEDIIRKGQSEKRI